MSISYISLWFTRGLRAVATNDSPSFTVKLRRGFGVEGFDVSDFNLAVVGHVAERSTGAGLWAVDEAGLLEVLRRSKVALNLPTFHGSWRGISEGMK